MSRGLIARMQHVSLEVSDPERSIAFYREILGFKVTERRGAGALEGNPEEMVFLRLGSRHHDLVLVHNPQIPFQPVGAGRFNHFGLECDTREAWEGVVEKVQEMQVPVADGPVVHSRFHPDGDGSWGETQSIYICDPDGHRVEVFWALAIIDADGAHVDHRGQRLPGTATDEL